MISFDDGAAKPLLSPCGINTNLAWTEELLQHVLLLNPQLLDVSDHIPLKLDGGSTAVSPDQLYMDDVGRLVIVEIKNECANLAAIAQLLSYSLHYGIMPLGELDLSYLSVAAQGTCLEVMKNSLKHLQSWAKTTHHQSINFENDCVNQWKVWPNPKVDSLRAFTQRIWGEYACSMRGAPARLILIAPDFDKQTIELAKHLRKRYVPIELIQANINVDAESRVALNWNHIFNLSCQIEPTWRMVRNLWRSDSIRNYFVINAWADHLYAASFSFSAYDAPQARFWIDVDEEKGMIFTTVPDGWYSGTSQRKWLRQALLNSVPSGWVPNNGRWMKWEFKLPSMQDEFNECVNYVANAVQQILVSHAP